VAYHAKDTVPLPFKHGKKIKLSKHYEAVGLGPWRHSPLRGGKWMK